MAALHWLVEGYGYQITNLDVQNAYSHSMKAAENAGCAEQTQERIRDLVSRETFGERFVTKVLGRQLGLS
jgi:serine protease inhibitor